MCFDLVVISKTPGLNELTWKYYYTMLNSTHVNAFLLAALLQTGIGALTGLTRQSSALRFCWVFMIASNLFGFGCYFAFVVPRYLQIRDSIELKVEVFDDWHVVFAARIWMFGCIAMGMLSCIYVKLSTCDWAA